MWADMERGQKKKEQTARIINFGDSDHLDECIHTEDTAACTFRCIFTR